jgi:hypothetical protein
MLKHTLFGKSAEAVVSHSGMKARAAKSGVHATPVPEAFGQPICLAFDLLPVSASKIGGYSLEDSSVSGNNARSVRPQKLPA